MIDFSMLEDPKGHRANAGAGAHNIYPSLPGKSFFSWSRQRLPPLFFRDTAIAISFKPRRCRLKATSIACLELAAALVPLLHILLALHNGTPEHVRVRPLRSGSPAHDGVRGGN
jgi:hypothetical protein